MAQTTFSVRMDENLKKQFDSLCADFGMNASTAFNIFARAVVREQKIPFEISAKASHKPLCYAEMTKDEFDYEMAKGLASLKAGKGSSLEEVEAKMRRDYGL